MPFSTGDPVGPYQITGLLGTGGMGEVYRARDPRLERDVAIKVLPAALVQNRDRLTRFEREAKVLAALNHPNIATIYGVEDRAIVMELVEGPTLADRLASGPLPREEAILIAQQIAAALEAAHEKGVVHRDLKPANVKASLDGPVKVLDFGLATAVKTPASEPGEDRSKSPTRTVGATDAGVILGTAGYMSPEQAAGRSVDKRSDIWSFGVVLWEMLSGERLFADGESVAHILADVLRGPIDLEKIPAGTLRELLRRCLDRDVKTRLRDIGEARIALSRAERATESPVRAGSRASSWRAWAVAAVAGIAAVAAWIPWNAEPGKPLRRLEVDLGSDVRLNRIPAGDVVISPDATRLVYSSTPSGQTPDVGSRGRGGRGGRRGPRQRLFIRRLDQKSAVELPGTEGAVRPFFSPDSLWVGFFTGDGLFKVSVDGGPVVALSGDDAAEGSWGVDGTIVVGTDVRGGTVRRISESSGEAVTVPGLPQNIGFLDPQMLPGGKTALFTVLEDPNDRAAAVVEAVSLDDGARTVLVRGASNARYLPSGHLTYVRDGTLFAIRFDPQSLATRGEAVPVVEDVWRDQSGVALSFSRDGTLVYRKTEPGQAEGPIPLSTIDWIDASGRRSPIVRDPQRFYRPRVSPDGDKLAVSISDGDSRDFWVYDLRRNLPTKITFGGLGVPQNSAPEWTPDSRYVIFGSSGTGDNRGGVYWATPDGASQPKLLLETKGAPPFLPSYSDTAKRLAYFQSQPGGLKIFTVPMSLENGEWKAGTPELFLPPEFSGLTPVFSPDGRWIAYTSDESPTRDVNVRAYPPPVSGPGRKFPISTGGGAGPHWWGNDLIYATATQIVSVRYSVRGDEFIVEGKPRVRADRVGEVGLRGNWDVAPDGRILVLTAVSENGGSEPPAARSVVLLQNFFDELRRRVK